MTVFTSIHIEEFEVVARDTKLGKEEITRDIPNLGDEALKNLDESGIIRIGAEVKPGDILVGQDHPQGRNPALSGRETAPGDLRRKGRRCERHLPAGSAGVEGTVIDAKIFARKGVEKDARAESHRRRRDCPHSCRTRTTKSRSSSIWRPQKVPQAPA